MADTAQPLAAETDPNVQLQDASDAFKTFTSGGPAAPQRDALEAIESAEPNDEIEAVEDTAAEDDAAQAGDDGAPDEGQPGGAEMPAFWDKDQTALWAMLPPEAHAYIAAREGERDRAVYRKFQETADTRQAFDARLREANADRDRYAAAIGEVIGLVVPQRPDPRAFGAGTGEYDRERYDLACAEFAEQTEALDRLIQQRQAIAAQQEQESEEAARAARETIEETWRPRFIAAVPDITDPRKGGEVLAGLADYAVANGIPPALFADERQVRAITSAELLILHKAMRFDALEAAKGTLRHQPAPRPASPTARPSTTTSRSAQKATAFRRDSDRLAKEGSIDAGAAVFRHFLK